jgi:hypothetical protein
VALAVSFDARLSLKQPLTSSSHWHRVCHRHGIQLSSRRQLGLRCDDRQLSDRHWIICRHRSERIQLSNRCQLADRIVRKHRSKRIQLSDWHQLANGHRSEHRSEHRSYRFSLWRGCFDWIRSFSVDIQRQEGQVRLWRRRLCARGRPRGGLNTPSLL